MAGLPTARMDHKPLQEYEAVPTTPGRIAFLFACAGVVTFGVLSPIGLIVSVLALLQKADGWGAAGLLLSAIAVLVWVDIIFFGGVLVMIVLGLFAGP
ncbi:MAG: hypothetical protein RIB58_03035 [Phycisphaerales bacterium]